MDDIPYSSVFSCKSISVILPPSLSLSLSSLVSELTHMKNISISLVSMFTSYLYMNACACQSPRHVRLGHRVAWSCEVPLCHENILPKWKMESRDFTQLLEYLGPARFGRIMKSLYLGFDTDDRPHQLGWQWVARRWTTAYKCIATTPMQSARKATPGFSISIMTFLEGFWGLLGMFWCFWCSK